MRKRLLLFISVIMIIMFAVPVSAASFSFKYCKTVGLYRRQVLFEVSNTGKQNLVVTSPLKETDSQESSSLHLMPKAGVRDSCKTVTIKPGRKTKIYFRDLYDIESDTLDRHAQAKTVYYAFNFKYGSAKYYARITRTRNLKTGKYSQKTDYIKGTKRISSPYERATYSKYRKIKTGMTWSQVYDIMGFGGDRTSSSGSYEVYAYEGEYEYSYVYVEYDENDKVVYKWQQGL